MWFTVSTESCELLQNISGFVEPTCRHCLESDDRNVALSSIDAMNCAPSLIIWPTSAAICRLSSPKSHTDSTDTTTGNGMVVTSSCSQFSGRLDDYSSCFQRYRSAIADKVNNLHDNRCHDDIDDEVQEILLPTQCASTSSCRLAESSCTNNGTFNCSTRGIQQRQDEGHSYHISLSSTQRPSLNLYKMRVSTLQHMF